MKTPKRKSNLSWERFLLGEASNEEKKDWENQILNDPLLKQQYEEELKVKNEVSFKEIEDFIQSETVSETHSRPVTHSGSQSESGILDKIKYFLSANPNWAYSLSLLVVLSSSFIAYRHLTSSNQIVLSSKGRTQINLELQGKVLSPSEFTTAKVGDTLSIQYMSSNPVHIQLWYQDDDEKPNVYLNQEGKSVLLDHQPSMASLPQKVVLEGGWKSEKIFLLSSSKSFTSEEARNVISGKINEDVVLSTFFLNLN